MEVTGETEVSLLVKFGEWDKETREELIAAINSGGVWTFTGWEEVTLDHDPEPQHNEGMD